MAGLGSLPSSRIAKQLQEKAEQLKKRRQTAETVLKEVDRRVRLLESTGVAVAGLSERRQTLKDLERRSEWEALETEAKDLLGFLQKEVVPAFAERRDRLARRVDRLTELGRPLAEEVHGYLGSSVELLRKSEWGLAFEQIGGVDRAVQQAEMEFVSSLEGRVRVFATWTGAEGDLPADLEQSLATAARELVEGSTESGRTLLGELLTERFPGGVRLRETRRREAERAIPAARELGASTAALESLLDADRKALPIDWPATVVGLEHGTRALTEVLREKVRAGIEALRTTLEALRGQGVDPGTTLEALQELDAQTGALPASELPGLALRSREVAEGPVVSVVAGILDEVRPKLVEARRLGRDPSDVFAAMNRAREALRLRIYGEAIAASQEALDRISRLIEDVEAARSEVESLHELLGHLADARFPTGPFEAQVARAAQLVERGATEGGRRLLRETVTNLGREALGHFQARLSTAEEQLATARERGFVPSDVVALEREVRRAIDEGRLTDVGELLGRIDSQLRAAAAPYMSRRLDELDKGLSEIPDEALVTPVRRLMADADVNLRVKEDLGGSLDCLKRAEREFSSVFAARASSLVEALAQERRVLEEMGGAGDEIQREIDEVEQIFNMGDFVKASRVAQDIRNRTFQQQLLRSEEALSHAKLALVELGTMGLDPAQLRSDLERAQESARNGQYADAYRGAETTTRGARALKTEAQQILDLLAEAGGLQQQLSHAGQSIGEYRPAVEQAKQAYQNLDFSGARTALGQLRDELTTAQLHLEAGRLVDESKLLLEDARRLSLPLESPSTGIAKVERRLAEGQLREAVASARELHQELVSLVRPALEESLRAFEADADTARGVGLDLSPVLGTLAEARRRLAQAVPTGVAELVDSARSQFVESRGFLEHAERALRRATEALNQAELVRVEIAPARERMIRVQTLITGRDYARAIEQASALERELTQATFQQVSKVLAGFHGMVSRARREGANTTLAENFLAQAKNALENSQSIEALQLAARAESEIERVELQQQIARGSLETMERKVRGAAEEGVLAPAAAEQLGRARTAFAQHDYVEVLESTLATSDSLALARESHRRSTEAIDFGERQLGEAQKLGAVVTDAATTLRAARELLATGEYGDAIRRAREASEKARWATERLYSGALDDGRQQLELARRFAPDRVPEISTALDEAEAALKAREWPRVTELLQRTGRSAETALGAALEERWAGLRSAYERNLPIDDGEKERRAEVEQRLAVLRERRAYVEGFELVVEEAQRLQALRGRELGRRVHDLEESLLLGEKLGVDTTPVMQLFSEAKLAFEAGKLEPVPAYVERALHQLGEIVRPRVDEKLRDLRAEVVFAREGLNVALGPVDQLLQGVPGMVQRGNLVDAARMLVSAEEQLSQRKAQHRELLNLHYIVDAALAQAQARHLDTTRARELLAESIQARASDYGAALDKARQAHELLKSMLRPAEAPTGLWPFRRPPPGSVGASSSR